MRCSTLAALTITLAVAAGAGRSESADLRVTIPELAKIATASLADAKLRLHNVPGGFFSLTEGSYLKIGDTKIAIPVAIKPFDVAGGRYTYYANEVNSTGLTIAPVAGALRVNLTFEDAAPELIGKCTSGFCPPDSVLPQIEWLQPSVTIELAPVLLGDGLSLEVKTVSIGGKFEPQCAASSSLIARSACRVVLPRAKEAVAALDLNSLLKNLMNAPDSQKKLADGIKGKLVIGPAGQLKVSAVKIEGDTLAMTFCLAC